MREREIALLIVNVQLREWQKKKMSVHIRKGKTSVVSNQVSLVERKMVVSNECKDHGLYIFPMLSYM